MSIDAKKVEDDLALQQSIKLTTPFDLERYLKRPKMKLDLVPVLDLIILACLISLLFTRYLMLPGVQIDLPKAEFLVQQNASRVAVLTIANEEMLFFAGSVHEQNSIEQAFQQYFDNNKSESSVLLLKAQASMDIQQLLRLCKMAQNAGFSEVQIAADPKTTEQRSTINILSNQSNDLVFPTQ